MKSSILKAGEDIIAPSTPSGFLASINALSVETKFLVNIGFNRLVTNPSEAKKSFKKHRVYAKLRKILFYVLFHGVTVKSKHSANRSAGCASRPPSAGPTMSGHGLSQF